jgi:hypothetical protein
VNRPSSWGSHNRQSGRRSGDRPVRWHAAGSARGTARSIRRRSAAACAPRHSSQSAARALPCSCLLVPPRLTSHRASCLSSHRRACRRTGCVPAFAPGVVPVVATAVALAPLACVASGESQPAMTRAARVTAMRPDARMLIAVARQRRAAIQRSIFFSSTSSGTAPSPSTSRWNSFKSNFGPSWASALRRSAWMRKSPTL